MTVPFFTCPTAKLPFKTVTFAVTPVLFTEFMFQACKDFDMTDIVRSLLHLYLSLVQVQFFTRPSAILVRLLMTNLSMTIVYLLILNLYFQIGGVLMTFLVRNYYGTKNSCLHYPCVGTSGLFSVLQVIVPCSYFFI